MQERGVIKLSGSPWASPIVLVKKMDGTTHFCVNFRKVNAVSGKDAYPLPQIDECINMLGRIV